MQLLGRRGASHPSVFHGLLMASVMRPELFINWWQAQSATYLVRPNERTLPARDGGAQDAGLPAGARSPWGAVCACAPRGQVD